MCAKNLRLRAKDRWTANDLKALHCVLFLSRFKDAVTLLAKVPPEIARKNAAQIGYKLPSCRYVIRVLETASKDTFRCFSGSLKTWIAMQRLESQYKDLDR